MITRLFFQPSAWLLASLLALTGLFSACQPPENDVADTTDYATRDEGLITAYIKDNNLTGFQRQPSGLYVAVIRPGTGDTARTGQRVTALYTGQTLDGRVFDSTSNRDNEPFSFTLGQGQVIRGWDLGFALLPQGSKATLLLPSTLAYGSQATGPIPAHAVLRFDVEVLKVQ